MLEATVRCGNCGLMLDHLTVVERKFIGIAVALLGDDGIRDHREDGSGCPAEERVIGEWKEEVIH